MKLRSLLLAGAVTALPLSAFAQEPNPNNPNNPNNNQSQQTETNRQTTTTERQSTTTEQTDAMTTTGTVRSYEAGRSITITNDKGEPVTYVLNTSSEVPKTIEVGKTVTIRTTNTSGTPVVKTITTTTTTKETKRKSY
jgi:hypothetical protein